ncbi:hypothetical protein HMI46_17535 [Paenibacillus alvei]|uniref:Uncharacterized protein n=1 Tax=Paenibacillus alvei TaxID=44250 RepID=A0AAP7DK42_PAEAL|nr:hypothetical protein [Paenibacillus alvei]
MPQQAEYDYGQALACQQVLQNQDMALECATA